MAHVHSWKRVLDTLAHSILYSFLYRLVVGECPMPPPDRDRDGSVLGRDGIGDGLEGLRRCQCIGLWVGIR